MLHRPEITEEIITQINNTIKEHPEWTRTQISKHLCEEWDWKFPDGRCKDISCRDMLRLLDKRDKISLPPAKVKGSSGKKRTIPIMLHDTTSVTSEISKLLPLKVESTVEKHKLDEFKSYIEQYHYLGFDRTIGENMKYMIYSSDGTILSCLIFGSAAWSCHDRDSYIEWNKDVRIKNLQLISNNTRFLILPWVNVPHLASHILSLIVRRVSSDWEKKYGHPLYCLETFVECDRFRGTCYRAANWIKVGKTVGRGRNDTDRTTKLPIKDIYLYPLHKKYKTLLCEEEMGR